MDELYDRRQADVGVALVLAGTRREQDRERPQAFAAAVYDVGTELVDEGDVRLQALADGGIDGLQVVLDKRDDPGQIGPPAMVGCF